MEWNWKVNIATFTSKIGIFSLWQMSAIVTVSLIYIWRLHSKQCHLFTTAFKGIHCIKKKKKKKKTVILRTP